MRFCISIERSEKRMMTTRADGREFSQMRKVSFELGVQKHADGSVLVSFGDTRVICAASLQEKVPGWLKGRGQGWMTAEYAMLPQATNERTERDGSRGKANARS